MCLVMARAAAKLSIATVAIPGNGAPLATATALIGLALIASSNRASSLGSSTPATPSASISVSTSSNLRPS